MEVTLWVLLTATAILRVDSQELFLQVDAPGTPFKFDEDKFDDLRNCLCNRTTQGCTISRYFGSSTNKEWVQNVYRQENVLNSMNYSSRYNCNRNFQQLNEQYVLECTRQKYVECSGPHNVWVYRIEDEDKPCDLKFVGMVWAEDHEVKFVRNDSVVGVCEAGCNISTSPESSLTEEECTAAQGPGDEDEATNDEVANGESITTGVAVGVSVAGVVIVVAVVVVVLVTFVCKRKRRAVTGKRRSSKKDFKEQNANGAAKDEGSHSVQDISMLVEQQGSNYYSLDTDQNYSTTAISEGGKLYQPFKVIPNSYASQSEYSEVGESFCKVDGVNDRSNGSASIGHYSSSENRAVADTGNSADVTAYACSNLAVSNTENSEYSKLHDVVRNFTDVYSVLPPSGDDGT